MAAALVVSLVALVAAVFFIVSGNDCDKTNAIGIITTVLGFWANPPQNHSTTFEEQEELF